MHTVVGVSFKDAGKIYYFDPGDIELETGDNVIVETSRGMEFGEVILARKEVSDDELVAPLKEVKRRATMKDKEKHEKNQKLEEEAYDICLEKIDDHGLPMKLIDVEYTFNHNKIIFYFTADGRVDFRELVKDLASVFKTRIELRQIGVRDEAKMVGGLGPCGRSTCCGEFLRDFEPVSIQLAKKQDLSLNPAKISGLCGRLMCCLKYECETYKDLKEKMPDEGTEVDLKIGKGEIVNCNLIKQTVKIKINNGEFVERKVKELEGYDIE
ncbi:MAG: PSP1 domain-containing protein [Bacillota bacterium]